MTDFRYHGIGLLVSLRPLTDRAREFCDRRWPKGSPNTCRNTHGGQLLGSEDFEAALVAIADSGLEAEHRPSGNSYNEMEAANRATANDDHIGIDDIDAGARALAELAGWSFSGGSMLSSSNPRSIMFCEQARAVLEAQRRAA